MRRLAVLAAVTAFSTACTSQVTPTNPYDPATPPELQAKAALRGTLVTALLASRANMPVGLRKDGRPQTPTQTDAAGFFVFSSLVPGDYQAEIAPTGFVPVTIQVRLAPGQELDLGDIGLTPLSGAQGAAIRGRVTLEGATADLSGTLVEAVGTAFTAVTSSTGDFQLPLIPGSYTLRYTHPAFKPLTAPTQVVLASGETYVLPEDVLLYINPAHLAGLVLGETAGGPPAPLSLVDVTVDGHTGLSRTGPSGEYQLDVPAGSYLVRLHKAGYADVTVPVFDLVGGGLYDLGSATMALARGGVAGRVALADGGDPSGTVVEVTGEGRATVASSDGRFAFDGLLAGRVYEVTARRDGYTRAQQGSLDVVEGAVADAGTLTLARQGGTVTIATPYVNAADRVVRLQLNATGVTHYLASEDAGFADPAQGDTLAGTAWRPFTAGSAYDFTLADADGEHVVYVIFSSGGANPGAPMSASVVLDRLAPVAPGLVVGDGSGWSRTTTGLVSLALSAQDLAPGPGAVASGLDKVQLVNGTTFAGPGLQTLPYNTSAAWSVEPVGSDGVKTISARFVDRAGNVSAPVTATVTVDTQRPTAPALALSGPDAGRPGFTTSPIVTAALDAVDASGGVGNALLLVKLSNSPGFVGARYQPYAPALSWVLTPGDGTKTVFAQFMDPAGNESDPVQAQIELKTAGPTAPSLVIDEHDARPANGFTSDRTVSLRLQAVGGAVTAVVAENPALTGGVTYALAGQPVPYQPDFTLADADGLHTLWVRYADAAGNASDLATAAVTLDRAAPAATAPALSPAGWATTTAASLALPAAGQDEVQVDGAGVTAVPWTPAPAGAVVPLTLTAGDGAKALTVTYRDLADNRSAAIPLTLSLDATPPTAAGFTVTGALADGAASTGTTTTRVVTLDFAGTSDAGSGLAEMQLSEDAGLAGAGWQPFASPATFTLSAGDGPKTIRARFRDAAGNATTAVVTGTIALDTTAPTGGAVALAEQDSRPANGATNARGVVLTLTAAGATRAQVAENPSFFGAVAVGGPFPVTTPASGAGSIQLSDADGLHVLWVRFLDAAGNASTPVSAQVTLDRVAPLAVAPTLSAAGFITPSTGLSLTLPAAGQDEVQVGGAGVIGVPFTAAAPGAVVPLTLTGADGVKPFTVTYRDLADNQSAAVPLSVTVDGTPPSAANFTVTGALADGTASTGTTATRSVTLAFAGVADAGAGLQEMQLSEDPALAGAAWQPSAATAAFTLSAGDATKTVYARFRDAVGNATVAAVTGTITLDTTAPTGGTATITEQDSRPANGSTNSRNVSLTLNASGATRALVAENPSFFGATTVTGPFPVATPATGAGAIPLSDADGVHTIWVRFYDDMGNASTPVAASVTLDRVAPTATAPTLSPSGYATSTSASLTMPSAGQDQVQVGGAGVSAVAWTDAAAGAVVPLTLVGPDGVKAIAVTYRDLADNQSAAIPLSLTLDTTAPAALPFTVTGQLADGTASTTLTATTAVTLNLSGQTDATSGIQDVLLSNDPLFAGAAWQSFVSSAKVPWVLSPGDGAKIVYAQFRDRAGKVSATVQGPIQLSGAPPTGGTLSIEGGAVATNKCVKNGQTVRLALASTGAAQMQVTVDGLVGDWEDVAAVKDVLLPWSVDGTVVVSVVFRTLARVEGAGAAASILLDTTPPVLDALALTGTLADSQTSTTHAAGPVVVATSTWKDDPGLTHVAYVEGAACAFGATPAWQPFAPSGTFVLSAGDGVKTVCAALEDEAGNVSAPQAASLTLDTVAPPNPVFTNLTSRITNQRTVTGTVAALGPDAPPATAVEYQCLGGAAGTAWTTCALPGDRSLSFALALNQENQLGIRTRDQAHNVSTGSVVTVTHDGIAPQAPSLTAVTTTSDSLTLRWQRSPDADVADYQVSYGNSAGDVSGTGAAQGASPIAMGSAAATQLVLTGLTSGTPYYVSVQAVDRAGNASVRSAQRVAVPNVANPRLLGSLGGKPTGVAVLAGTGGKTWAYLAEHLGLLQLDVSNDGAAPTVAGRVPLDNFEPDVAEPAVFGCTWQRTDGHCVVLSGSTMEGDYRGQPLAHRNASPVVFFPAAGGLGTQLTLMPAAPLAVAASTIGGVPVVAAVEARAVRFFSLADPANPNLLASVEAPNGGAWGAVDAVDFTGARLLVLADGGVRAYDADAVVVAGTVVDHGDLGSYPPGHATAHQGYVVSDQALQPCDPVDPDVCFPPYEEILVTEPVTGDVADLSSAMMVDGNAPTAFAKGAGAVWAFHGGSPFALHVHVGGPGVASAAIVRDANVPGTNALAGVRTGTVATLGGVEHLFQLRTVAGREVLERATGAAAPTYLANPYQEITTDRFAVVGATIYVPEIGVIRAIDAGNPLAPTIVGSAGGTANVTYLNIHSTGGLLAATWNRTAAPNWGIDLFWPVRGAPPKFIVSLPGTNVGTVAIAGNFVFAGSNNSASLDVWSFTTGVAPTATKRVSAAAYRADAIAVRPDRSAGANVFAVYAVDGATSKVQPLLFNPATFALSAAVTTATLPGLGLSAPITATAYGSMLLVSDTVATYRVDLGAYPAMTVGTTNGGVAGRVVLQGGYLAGLAPSGQPHGPVLATATGGMVDGALPFSSCSAGGPTGAATFQAEGAVQYASCRQNGLIISTLANPSSGHLFKQYGGVLSPGFGDGVTSWSADFMGKLVRIDEQPNAASFPTPPASVVDLGGKSAVLAEGGWGYSLGIASIRSWLIQPDGTWSATGGSTLAVSGDWWRPPTHDGRRLYTVDSGVSLRAVDVTSPGALSSVIGATLGSGGFVQAVGSRLLVGDGSLAKEFDTTTQPFTLVSTVPVGSSVTGLATAGEAIFYSVAGWLGVYTPARPPAFPVATFQVIYSTSLTLSNPVVAGDILYVLENGTLLAFDLRPYFLDRTRTPVRLTPTSPDGVAVFQSQLWVHGPFAYGIVSSSMTDANYRAYDLR